MTPLVTILIFALAVRHGNPTFIAEAVLDLIQRRKRRIVIGDGLDFKTVGFFIGLGFPMRRFCAHPIFAQALVFVILTRNSGRICP
jgi:hypothetical protein